MGKRAGVSETASPSHLVVSTERGLVLLDWQGLLVVIVLVVSKVVPVAIWLAIWLAVGGLGVSPLVVVVAASTGVVGVAGSVVCILSIVLLILGLDWLLVLCLNHALIFGASPGLLIVFEGAGGGDERASLVRVPRLIWRLLATRVQTLLHILSISLAVLTRAFVWLLQVGRCVAHALVSSLLGFWSRHFQEALWLS